MSRSGTPSPRPASNGGSAGRPTTLFTALVRRDRGEVCRLLAAGADPDGVTPAGTTPLWTTAGWGDLELMTALLDAGADPNLACPGGARPLHRAAGQGEVAAVRLLLRRGADPSAATDQHDTPLHLAAFKGHAEAAEALLEAGAPVDGPNGGAATPLLRTALRSHQRVMELLLERRADATAADSSGRTALLMCAGRHDSNDWDGLAVLRLLMSPSSGRRRAHVNRADRTGRTPLHAAAGAYQGAEQVRLLLGAGAKVNVADAKGATPLHAATGIAAVESVKLLLSAWADVRAPDAGGRTPLHLASQYRWRREAAGELINLLLRTGADVNARTAQGLTPLYLAIGGGVETLGDLLGAGADPNAALPSAVWEVDAPVSGVGETRRLAPGQTPLHRAAGLHLAREIELLLNHGAVAGAADARGDTALHRTAQVRPRAARWSRLLGTSRSPYRLASNGEWPWEEACRKSVTVAAFLLRGGAPVNARAAAGWTALHWAAALGNHALTAALLAAGADPDARDDRGKGPLCYAASLPELMSSGVVSDQIEAHDEQGARGRRGPAPGGGAR